MKITFACNGCGRTLKARPDSAGRTRKCPVCATRVTCPAGVPASRPSADLLEEDVVEAELVPLAQPQPTRYASAAHGGRPTATAPDPPPVVDPFADMGDDPYQLADPGPEAETSVEPKKPCPMCGETILASAVKCRYCGEVFDPKLKKGQSKKKKKRSSGGGGSGTAGRDIGIGLLCMVAGIGLTVATMAAAANNPNGNGRFVLFWGLILGGFFQMCRGIFNGMTGR